MFNILSQSDGSNSFQKFNRFFDSISLRWLLRDGESYEVSPTSDNITVAQVSEVDAREFDATAGLSSSKSSPGGPTLEVHVQNNHSMTTARNLKSWRRGVTVETCEMRCFYLYVSG